jgi:hypothetical protein
VRASQAIRRRRPLTRRLITLLLIAIPVCVLAAGQPSPSFGLRAEGTPGGGVLVPICAEKAVDVYLSKSPPVTGDKYFLDSKIEIDAVAHVTLAVQGSKWLSQ